MNNDNKPPAHTKFWKNQDGKLQFHLEWPNSVKENKECVVKAKETQDCIYLYIATIPCMVQVTTSIKL